MQDPDGTWRQVWIEVPVPPPPPPPPPPSVDSVLDDQVHAYEWADGNPDAEDRGCHTVSLDASGKIQIAAADDSAGVIGVVVPAAPGPTAAVALWGKRVVLKSDPKPATWVFVGHVDDATAEYFVK